MGLNWWLKPFKCHLNDPNSRFNRVLKLLFRSSAIEEQQQSLLPSQPSDNVTTNIDNEEMVEYHHLSGYDPSEGDEL